MKVWDDNVFPMAYFITWRTYGTWLHGDERGSVDRYHNQFGQEKLSANEIRRKQHKAKLKSDPVTLDAARRRVVTQAISDVCGYRNWHLHAVNVRTNHAHLVTAVGALKPEVPLRDFKSYSTRALRNAGLWNFDHSPWVDGGSNRYLWTEDSLWCACNYVLNEQGVTLPDF